MFDGVEQFDPDNVTPKTMKAIYRSLAFYIEDIVDEIMVPPEDMSAKEWERMQDNIKVAKKLLKRLKKNDTSVFVIDT